VFLHLIFVESFAQSGDVLRVSGVGRLPPSRLMRNALLNSVPPVEDWDCTKEIQPKSLICTTKEVDDYASNRWVDAVLDIRTYTQHIRNHGINVGMLVMVDVSSYYLPDTRISRPRQRVGDV